MMHLQNTLYELLFNTLYSEDAFIFVLQKPVA